MVSCSTYIFAGFNLTERLNIIGTGNSSTNIELSGHLDMPARIGKIYQDWAEENSVEPYVRADEIFFGGRDIVIDAYIKDAVYSEIYQLNKDLDAINGVENLETDFGIFPVTFVNMTVRHMQNGISQLSMKYRQAVVPIVEDWRPAVKSGGYGIDGYSWADLGLIPCRPDNDWGRADSKMLENSVYGFERNRVKWHKMNIITLHFLVRKPTYEEVEGAIKKFAALMQSEGKRMLSLKDGSVREVFAKDGFSVNGIRITSTETYANIVINVTEIRKLDNVIVMGDNTQGQVLGNKQGQRIAYTF